MTPEQFSEAVTVGAAAASCPEWIELHALHLRNPETEQDLYAVKYRVTFDESGAPGSFVEWDNRFVNDDCLEAVRIAHWVAGAISAIVALDAGLREVSPRIQLLN